jgi:predicted flap endonuclease-1-like 5' DNA nuclease
MSQITKIEGIGPSYAEKLKAEGISTTEKLLEQGAAPAGRKGLVESTGISKNLILRWINMADLFRIKGVGEEFADLLEAAGVDTVPELAQRNAKNLSEKMAAVNTEKNLVRTVPSQSSVEAWVEQAKELPRKITY